VAFCSTFLVPVCANANGAIIAQTRMIVIRLMEFPFINWPYVAVSRRALLSDASRPDSTLLGLNRNWQERHDVVKHRGAIRLASKSRRFYKPCDFAFEN